MNKDSDWVVIGRFGRSHGIKGLITVISFTEPRDNILQYKYWHAHLNHQWQPLKLSHLERNHKFILAAVENFDTREEVARLTNVEIAIPSTELPVLQAGEYYWHELHGMQVVTTEGMLLGQVTEILATGSNDVLVVEGEKRHLLPYLPGKTVIEINDSQRLITVDWDVDF